MQAVALATSAFFPRLIARLGSASGSGGMRRNVTWVTLGAVIGRGCQVFGMMLAARMLGAEEFGRLGLFQSTALLLQAFVAVGLGIAIVKLVAEYLVGQPERIGGLLAFVRALSLATGCVLALATFASAGWAGDYLFGRPGLASVVVALGIYGTTLALAELEISVAIGLQAFRVSAAAQAINGVAALVGVVSGTWLAGLQGAAVGLACAGILALVVNYVAARRLLRTRGLDRGWRFDRADARKVIGYSAPTMITGLISAPALLFADLMLSRQDNGFVELGAFNIAKQWFGIVCFLPLMVTRVTLPAYSGARASEGIARVAATLRRHTVKIRLLTAAGAVPVALAAPWIMGAFGHEFEMRWMVMSLMMLVAIIQSPNGATQNFLIASGRPWLVPAGYLVWATALGPMVHVGATYGGMGVAIAFLVAQSIRNVLLHLFARGVAQAY